MMRQLFNTAMVLAAVLVAGPAAAQSTTELESQCHGSEGAIAACTALIDRGDARGQSLAAVYTLRGMAYVRTGDEDHALADFDKAIHLSPFYAPAFGNRANVYFARGDYVRALKDYDQAIRLDPNSSRTFSNRGNTHFEQEDYALAIRDYDQSIKLDPGRAPTLRSRGIAHFLLGDVDNARQDFARAAEADPADAYSLLWRDLADGEAGAQSRLAREAARVDLAKWPGPILLVFLGQGSVDQLRAANAAVTDAQMRAMQACETGFYLGERELLAKQVNRARELLQEAVTNCPHAFVEYHSAMAALIHAP